jgi:hypothetical protein
MNLSDHSINEFSKHSVKKRHSYYQECRFLSIIKNINLANLIQLI